MLLQLLRLEILKLRLTVARTHCGLDGLVASPVFSALRIRGLTVNNLLSMIGGVLYTSLGALCRLFEPLLACTALGEVLEVVLRVRSDLFSVLGSVLSSLLVARLLLLEAPFDVLLTLLRSSLGRLDFVLVMLFNALVMLLDVHTFLLHML